MTRHVLVALDKINSDNLFRTYGASFLKISVVSGWRNAWEQELKQRGDNNECI